MARRRPRGQARHGGLRALISESKPAGFIDQRLRRVAICVGRGSGGGGGGRSGSRAQAQDTGPPPGRRRRAVGFRVRLAGGSATRLFRRAVTEFQSLVSIGGSVTFGAGQCVHLEMQSSF